MAGYLTVVVSAIEVKATDRAVDHNKNRVRKALRTWVGLWVDNWPNHSREQKQGVRLYSRRTHLPPEAFCVWAGSLTATTAERPVQPPPSANAVTASGTGVRRRQEKATKCD